MKKYLKMIPVMLYPYAYLILIIFLVIEEKYFKEILSEEAVDNIYGVWFIIAIIYNLLVLFIVIYNTVVTGKGKYLLEDSAKINMLTKCVQIPAYIFHFIVGLVSFLMSIWGIGFLIFVILIDFITIALTGINSIGLYVQLRRERYKSKKNTSIIRYRFVYLLY